MPARSLRSRTRRVFARGPAALLDLRSARRPWGIRSGRRNDQCPIEQRNWETIEAQAGMAMAGSNGLPVFSTPKQITSSLRIAAQFGAGAVTDLGRVELTVATRARTARWRGPAGVLSAAPVFFERR